MEVKYYECDRCGARIEAQDTHYNVSIFAATGTSRTFVNNSREFYDLCEACKAAYGKWLSDGTH